MDAQRTRTRAHNESQSTNSIPIPVVPARSGYDDPSALSLRSDDDLVQSAQAGDKEAFAELCRRHAHAARRKIYGIVRHSEDAEDALQETLLRAYANLGRFRQSSKFSTWITAIGINTALTVIRQRKARREADIEPYGPEGPTWEILDQRPDPEHCIAKGQIILLLRTELKSLPPKIQKMLITYYGHDHSLKEVADALGISVAAAKSRLSRGRRTLRSSFARKGLLSSFR